MQNFLETVLQIVYALTVNLLHLLALISQLRPIVARYLLHGKRSLVDQSLDSQLEVLQLLLLLLGDAQADQFAEASLHEIVHSRH